MVLGYHLTFGAYGFWLPNDPRGSWSTYVGSRHLYAFGPASKVTSRDCVAHAEHDQRLRYSAKVALNYPPVVLTGLQARAAAHGIRQAVHEAGYVVYACAVMPNHVHLVVARHDREVKQMVSHFKSKATMEVRKVSSCPKDQRPVWERGGWAVFLSDESMLFNAIRYVEENPLGDGLPAQKWSFVTTYFGVSES